MSIEQDIERSKTLQLSIARHLFAFCEAHHIRVFAGWGTVLGAVRHQGFIPWDDDIDVAMLRDDYDRFIKQYVQLDDQSIYELYCFETSPECPFPFAKLRLKGTSIIQGDTTNKATDLGIAIDIFPLDKIPENKAEQKKYYRRIELWKQLFISSGMRKAGNLRASWQSHVFTAIRTVLHIALKPVSRKFLFKKYKEAVTSCRSCQSDVVDFYTGLGVAQPLTLSGIFPVQHMKFEDMTIPVPSNWEEHLIVCYGDYMKPPPENQRFGHRPRSIDCGPWKDADPPA